MIEDMEEQMAQAAENGELPFQGMFDEVMPGLDDEYDDNDDDEDGEDAEEESEEDGDSDGMNAIAETKEELEILQFLFVNPNPTESEIDNVIDDVLRMEDLNPSEFSKTEKLCLLLKIREYTFGNEITIKFKCSKCKKPAESTIFINNILELAKKHDDRIHGLFEKSENVTLEDILDEKIIEDMDYDEYEELSKNIRDYLDFYDFRIVFKCLYCKEENFSILNPLKILEFISEENFGSLSKYIHLLVYYGHLTRSDILEMTPLERIFELNLLQETQKEITKNKPIQMHIENIPGCKGLKKENEVEDVIVVFCSKAPGKEGMTVVGFYKNAVAYRFEQFMPFDNGYEQPFSFLAKEEDCVLIPYNKRHKDLRWRVPQSGKCGMTFGFGRSNVWYAGSDPENEEETSYVERMIKNIENYEN